MSSLLLHGLALCLLAVSWMKDQQKTRTALKKGWNSFCKILPQMLMVLLLVGLVLTLLMMVGIVTLPMETETIGRRPALLRNSLAFLLGSATAGPLYASFPVAAVTAKKGTSLFNILVFWGAGCSCNKMTQQCPQNDGKI